MTPHANDQPRVNRCVCFDVTFAQLKQWADERERETGVSVSLSVLQARFGCGSGCGLCVPYIRRMLTTGQTTFAVDESGGDEEDGPAEPN